MKGGRGTEKFPGIRRIAGYRKLSLIDWDGLLSCVVFLSGCSWRCPWCHNSSLLRESEGVTPEDLFSFLEKKKEWLDGVVLTGGEPLLKEDALELLSYIKDSGFRVKLDTSGSRPDLLGTALERGLADYVALDIKSGLSPGRYSLATGRPGSHEPVIESAGILAASGVPCEYRTTLVPGIVEPDDIRFNARKLPAGPLCALQRFKNDSTLDPSMLFEKPADSRTVEKMASILREAGFKVKIRN